jgi:uncharacterized membrane protein YfcA
VGLILIGLVAGLFSALFGVGGGTHHGGTHGSPVSPVLHASLDRALRWLRRAEPGSAARLTSGTKMPWA